MLSFQLAIFYQLDYVIFIVLQLFIIEQSTIATIIDRSFNKNKFVTIRRHASFDKSTIDSTTNNYRYRSKRYRNYMVSAGNNAIDQFDSLASSQHKIAEYIRERSWSTSDRAVASRSAQRSSRDIQCYSCMSLSYQDNWEQLQSLYNLPNAFTNRCNDPFNERNVGTVNCSTICVALMEPQVQAGVFIGYMYIRGCMNNLLKNGFNQSALRTHRFFTMDMCRNLPRSQLFNPIRDSRMHPYGDVQLCTCYGERCNGAPNRASLPIRNNCHCWQTFIAIILLFVL